MTTPSSSPSSASAAPPREDPQDPEKSAAVFQERSQALADAVASRVLGLPDLIDAVVVALFAEGHVLLEGTPGLGKTLLVRTLAAAVRGEFSRIQFTPDLMPADVT